MRNPTPYGICSGCDYMLAILTYVNLLNLSPHLHIVPYYLALCGRHMSIKFSLGVNGMREPFRLQWKGSEEKNRRSPKQGSAYKQAEQRAEMRKRDD